MSQDYVRIKLEIRGGGKTRHVRSIVVKGLSPEDVEYAIRRAFHRRFLSAGKTKKPAEPMLFDNPLPEDLNREDV